MNTPSWKSSPGARVAACLLGLAAALGGQTVAAAPYTLNWPATAFDAHRFPGGQLTWDGSMQFELSATCLQPVAVPSNFACTASLYSGVLRLHLAESEFNLDEELELVLPTDSVVTVFADGISRLATVTQMKTINANNADLDKPPPPPPPPPKKRVLDTLDWYVDFSLELVDGAISREGYQGPRLGYLSDGEVLFSNTDRPLESLTLEPAPVPEPGTLSLVGTAIGACVLLRRRQRSAGSKHASPLPMNEDGRNVLTKTVTDVRTGEADHLAALRHARDGRADGRSWCQPGCQRSLRHR